MNIQAIKALIETLGIKDLSLQFDAEGKQIIARFSHLGQQHERKILFSDIESAFTDTSRTNESASNLDEPALPG